MTSKPMSEKEFLHQLRRGIGSVITELKQNSSEADKGKYRDILLRCCLKDISYDGQVEGTKGHYLYDVICALGVAGECLAIIAEAYRKRLSYGLFQQLTDVLQCYAYDGAERAVEVLESKYEQLKIILPKRETFHLHYCEREQFEYLMIDQMQRGNWKAFQQVVEDAGAIILARDDDCCSYYDWFLFCAEENFGQERVRRYFATASLTSANVSAFRDGYTQIERSRAEYQQTHREEKVTLDGLIERLAPVAIDKGIKGGMGYCYKFAKEALPDALIELAHYIDQQSAEATKAKLLQVFRRTDYPRDIGPLLRYVTAENDQLKDAAIMALARLKDARIRDLASRFLESGDRESALFLLKENWKKSDDVQISAEVLKSRRVTHAMQMALRDIYENHRSSSCGDILMHAYRHGECAFCRCGIVRAMEKNKVLTDAVLEECQYDSYLDTRKYANRLITKRRGTL